MGWIYNSANPVCPAAIDDAVWGALPRLAPFAVLLNAPPPGAVASAARGRDTASSDAAALKPTIVGGGGRVLSPVGSRFDNPTLSEIRDDPPQAARSLQRSLAGALASGLLSPSYTTAGDVTAMNFCQNQEGRRCMS